jgi:multidrug efflux pump subunit AcrA (membrane-fusion protein)
MRNEPMRALATMVGALALVGLAGCGGKATPASAAAGKPPVAVEVVPVTAGDVVQSIEVVGELAPRFSADVKAEFTAIVAEVDVTEWQRVGRGQPLARLDDRESVLMVDAARAALLQAQVAETRAARELERTRKLKEYGLATQSRRSSTPPKPTSPRR